ncbi:uncharacterized protein OGAPODRAFT_15746 [Ogataea polymorpha]|uniref:Uncharacterized protein n=1 Tax=Ogataea polymorpha TaxID=460523 RepID=A0A1B7SLX3_9ASCO|nr:uncharacterized protein OGAPODRAFT_15746 [Ogataea polymorpha]KAH3670122.1 hypothetical protein OGATHE_002935 [Ogataea polymorpha]OBA17489.1 hypothetical protein OGAPODRAFT_15746 [Ogataea polymorpha]
MSETVLLVNENKMPTYLSHAPTQLPSLDSVLSKIQSEQKWPLPNPTTPHLLALPAPPALLQPLSRPDIPSFNMPLASIRYTRQDPPHHVAPKVSLPTPEIATRPEKNSDSSPPMRRYKCKICSKMFTTSGHLARHTRIHTGVKNHICPYEGCGARFSRQDNCMQHYKTHLNTKKTRKRGRSV